MAGSNNKAILPDEILRRKNFDCFKSRYGISLEINQKELEKYRIEASSDDEAVLYIKDAVNDGDLRINSAYSPSYEAKRWAKSYENVYRRTTMAVLGMSTGIYLRAMYNICRADTIFFIFEPNTDLFAFLCAYIDFTDIILDERVKLFITPSQHARFSEELIQDVTSSRSETIKVITPFYSKSEQFDHACSEVEKIMDTNNSYLRGRGRKALKARLYAWNHMKSAVVLQDLKKVIPEDAVAVIVAAGPSLKKNVEDLKKLQKHAIIFCTDRAASVLDAHDIKPDFVTSFDTEKSSDYLKVSVLDGVPMICSYQLNIDSQKLFENRLIFMHGLSYENRLFGDDIGGSEHGIDLGGNVAGGTFVACQMLGIKTIILVGQDLAFVDNKHHADDKNEGIPESEIRYVEDVNGETVKTIDIWLIFKEFYERQIVLHPDLRVIDATEGGAEIKGTEVMTLSKAADIVSSSNCHLDFDFDSLPKAIDEEKCNASQKVLKGWIDELEAIIQISSEIVEMSNQLLKNCKYQDITDQKSKGKLKKLEQALNSVFTMETYKMLKDFWIQDMYSVPNRNFIVRNNEEGKEVFSDLISFFDHLPIDCRSLIDEIREAMEE